eukprot:scaffold9208_cov98-Isochrysis_galbana.AAC.7
MPSCPFSLLSLLWPSCVHLRPGQLWGPRSFRPAASSSLQFAVAKLPSLSLIQLKHPVKLKKKSRYPSALGVCVASCEGTHASTATLPTCPAHHTRPQRPAKHYCQHWDEDGEATKTSE